MKVGGGSGGQGGCSGLSFRAGSRAGWGEGLRRSLFRLLAFSFVCFCHGLCGRRRTGCRRAIFSPV